MKVVDNNKYPVSKICVALTNRSSGALSGLFFDFDQTYTLPKTNRSLPENGWLRDKTASF